MTKVTKRDPSCVNIFLILEFLYYLYYYYILLWLSEIAFVHNNCLQQETDYCSHKKYLRKLKRNTFLIHSRTKQHWKVYFVQIAIVSNKHSTRFNNHCFRLAINTLRSKDTKAYVSSFCLSEIKISSLSKPLFSGFEDFHPLFAAPKKDGRLNFLLQSYRSRLDYPLMVEPLTQYNTRTRCCMPGDHPQGDFHEKLIVEMVSYAN